MTRTRRFLAVLALTVPAVLAGGSLAAPPTMIAPLDVPGLEQPASVVRDSLGIPHVFAQSDHDAYFLVGWLHAQDRLFQMDQSRRQASGTLAELLGSAALPTDVQLRTLGLRRAAEKSLAALSPAAVADLEAYSAGVNAYVTSHPLPPEYAALELTSFPPWTPLDSVAVGKLLSFGLAFETNDIGNTQRLTAYRTALGAAAGTALFAEDVMRIEPFAHAPSILPGETSGPVVRARQASASSSFLSPSTLRHAAAAKRKLDAAGVGADADTGSNVWVVSGAKSATGRPMVASDPHLALPSPSTFYELGIRAKDLVLFGVTFPGLPSVVHGLNEHIAWGSTVNPTDVTDVFQESVIVSNGVPVATMFRGSQVPTQIFPQSYRANQPGNGTADDLVTVPPSASVPPVAVETRHGPLIAPNLSVQCTGFYATREVDYFRELARAEDVVGAKHALRYFDVGAQNWMFADDSGNIAYYTDHELPLREDLQAGTVDGLPPYFIRDGTGSLRHEWIPAGARPESHAIPFAILPDGELDSLVNPERGWISNANQDPTGQTFDNDALNELRPGGGIRYVSPGHSDGNRNTRVTKRIQAALADGSVSFAEMQSAQADVKLNDAEVLVPAIVTALHLAQTPGASSALAALGADPKVQEAVARLRAWDFSTPTGIPEGYDEADVAGVRAAADAGGDRRERCGHDLQPLARPGARRDRRRPADRGRARRIPAVRRQGDDRAATPGRLERRRCVRIRLLRRAGPGRATRARRGQERVAARCEPGIRTGLRRLDEPRRLPLGEAAPDHVRASARTGVLPAAPRRAHGSRARAAGCGDRRRLLGRRRLLAQPAGVRAQRLPLRQRPRPPLRRGDAAVAPARGPGDPGWCEREPVRPVLREPAATLADERLPPGDRPGGGDRARRARPRGVPPSEVTAVYAEGMDPLHPFSARTRAWFERAFAGPTPAQAAGWPAIAAGGHVLIQAPTGSGKTLAAFLYGIDRLDRSPGSGLRLLYVSPLKALNYDVERNLRGPLAGIKSELRVGVRTGDTSQKERRELVKEPPDILITTPESLFLMLTSQARETLRTIETVIVDEVHAVAGTKRGAHLALSLERLDALLEQPAQRIGLSATQRPLAEIGRFVSGDRPIQLVDAGTRKELDLEVVVPVEDLRELGASRELAQPVMPDGVEMDFRLRVDRPLDLALDLPGAARARASSTARRSSSSTTGGSPSGSPCA